MTRISATASDALFRVDGQPYRGAAMFSWPAGSKHTLEIDPMQFTNASTKGRYTFQHWSTPTGASASPSNLLVISADPAVGWYNADLTTEYALTLVFFQCPDDGCSYPGTIWINQVAYRESADVWLAAGSTASLAAAPNPGFIFAGWWQGSGQPSSYSFTLTAPLTLYPRFAPARQVQLSTSPDGLQLLVDRALVTAPLMFDWGADTAHTLAPVSPQFDQHGRQWVFRAWSDGGDPVHQYKVPSGAAALAIVAQFVPAVTAAFFTEPAGLSLAVDGVDAASPRFAAWGAGETHTVMAPQHQTDSAGNPWVFRQWSAGTGGTQTIVVTDAQVNTGIRLSAAYDPLSRVQVDSTPSGLILTVDGADCHTPCEVERPVGSTVLVTGAASLPAGDGVRLNLSSWEGAAGGTLKTLAGYQKVVAHYQWSYLLALSVSPAGSGLWRLSPATSDGYYPAGTSVSVGIDPGSGLVFRQWEQDLSGAVNPTALLMNSPHFVRAVLDHAPDTATSLRVVNAAGDTPSTAVAAGSIATLFGENLSDATVGATADPLPQSLGGATLMCSGRLLPLLYVSPEQINFQVPGDLQPGKYQLELHRGNGATTIADFEVARDAPGVLAVTHLDGSPVTAESAARRGESVVLYATGVGPFQPKALDGFHVPATPVWAVADPVSVLLEGRALTVDSAQAAPGTVGVAIIQVCIPDDLTLTSSMKLSLQVRDTLSNNVALPVK